MLSLERNWTIGARVVGKINPNWMTQEKLREGGDVELQHKGMARISVGKTKERRSRLQSLPPTG